MTLRNIIGLVLVIIGAVLMISCLYNGFWVGAYSKATFQGLLGFASINSGLSLDGT